MVVDILSPRVGFGRFTRIRRPPNQIWAGPADTLDGKRQDFGANATSTMLEGRDSPSQLCYHQSWTKSKFPLTNRALCSPRALHPRRATTAPARGRNLCGPPPFT